jgi:hypothetical protein
MPVQVAAPADADAESPEDGTPFVQQAKERKIVYTADLALSVLNMEKARQEIDAIVKAHGAFYQDATLEKVSIRIAPEEFDAALKDLAGLGETLSREVKSDDVTAQYFDLAIRIEVAEKSRQRLIDLLATAKEVKDVLEVERDIRRLTEEIETIKGQMRVMSDRIAYATINVQLLERMPDQTKLQRRLSENRFPWIGRLQLTTMMDSVRGDAPIDGGSWFKRTFAGPLFALDVKGDQGVPEGFVPLLHTRDLLFATTAEDYRLRVLYHEPRQESDLDFWARAIKAEFEYNRGYVVDEGAEFPLTGKGLTARLLKCEANMGGETWNYCVWLVQETDDADSVVSIEFACTQKDFETYRQRVEDAVKGIEVD